jgi:hypothetical protein
MPLSHHCEIVRAIPNAAHVEGEAAGWGQGIVSDNRNVGRAIDWKVCDRKARDHNVSRRLERRDARLERANVGTNPIEFFLKVDDKALNRNRDIGANLNNVFAHGV